MVPGSVAAQHTAQNLSPQMPLFANLVPWYAKPTCFSNSVSTNTHRIHRGHFVCAMRLALGGFLRPGIIRDQCQAVTPHSMGLRKDCDHRPSQQPRWSWISIEMDHCPRKTEFIRESQGNPAEVTSIYSASFRVTTSLAMPKRRSMNRAQPLKRLHQTQHGRTSIVQRSGGWAADAGGRSAFTLSAPQSVSHSAYVSVSLRHSLSESHTHTHSLTHTHSHTHSHTRAHTRFITGRRQDKCRFWQKRRMWPGETLGLRRDRVDSMNESVR